LVRILFEPFSLNIFFYFCPPLILSFLLDETYIYLPLLAHASLQAGNMLQRRYGGGYFLPEHPQ